MDESDFFDVTGWGAGPVTTAHQRWLDLPEQQYSAKALRFVRKAIGGGYRKQRHGRISVSSLGYCERRQVFQYVNAPPVPSSDGKGRTLMDMGVWGHLRWQAEGLTAGWLQRAEVWVSSARRGSKTFQPLVGGSMDGILSKAHAFELKTTNHRTFKKIQTGKIPVPHAMQINAYMMLAPTIERFSLVYETREWADFFETIVTPDEEVQGAVKDTVQRLREHIEEGTLPDVLEECSWQQGWRYHDCPFRKICLKVGDQADVEAYAAQRGGS